MAFYHKEFAAGWIIAKEKSAGIELLKRMVNQNLPVVVPDENLLAKNVLVESGYVLKKRAPRMIKGTIYLLPCYEKSNQGNYIQ